MTDAGLLILVAVSYVVIISSSLAAIRSAYRNGVTDGYGYAREPWNPGYHDAGLYLRENMAHRWPDLEDDAD